ncbi:MAG TPA: indolepyruvate ferredoxin oxidoreductase subunit alpha, partial [Syntrophobacteraceae bacterium]|nr:indolepyruvate ferredoxin oxidoreductase subunit alpha [Syntrophobacteraceae bacterium]
AESSALNFTSGEGRWGIVTSGVSYLYVRDAIQDLGLQDRVKVLKIGFSHPHPKVLFQAFLRTVDKVLVVEELEPFLEESLKVAAQEGGLTIPIAGKGRELIPREFELDAVKVKRAVSRFFGVPYDPPKVFSIPELPQRPPNLCPGCPHRATFYAVKQTFGQDA